MGIEDLKNEIAEEVKAILATEFQIEVSNTEVVPHSGEAGITFPNLDNNKQSAKLIDTCVLYIDIRRSTELSLKHRTKTVAKLYSAFVRAMTRCARYHKGHVRGIIGDRVMVIFDRQNAFVNAVECAFSMNSVSQFILNKYFTANEVTCGIGIDAGNMLATKTGIRRRGIEQNNYRSLVWLGRPANIASKLTDLANKPEDSFQYPLVEAAFSGTFVGDWNWRTFYPNDFVRQLVSDSTGRGIHHQDPTFIHMNQREATYINRPRTSPILMTEAVWNGYKAAKPDGKTVVNGWFKEVRLSIPGYTGKVFSGDVHFTEFKG